MTTGLWITIGIAVVSALVSLVFGVLSWAAKRELDRSIREFQEIKTHLKDLQDWKAQASDLYMTQREFARIESMREKQEALKAEQDRRLEANISRLTDLLGR